MEVDPFGCRKREELAQARMKKRTKRFYYFF